MVLEGVSLPGFPGRIAVVTGAGRNIGRAIADSESKVPGRRTSTSPRPPDLAELESHD